MGIDDRLRELAAQRGMTLKELANVAEVPYRTLQNWVYGVRPPSVEAVAAICTRLGVDANWLLLGQTGGGSAQSTREPPWALGTTADHEARERRIGHGLIDGLGLGQAALAARQASLPLMWRIARLLLQHEPRGCTLEELVERLTAIGGPDAEDIHGSLSLLRQSGVVQERLGERAPTYVVVGGLRTLRFRDADEVSAGAVTVIEELTGTILPAVAEGRGKMVTASLRVPQGRGGALAARILDELRDRCSEDGEQAEDDDQLTLVLGLAVEPHGLLDSTPHQPSGLSKRR